MVLHIGLAVAAGLTDDYHALAQRVVEQSADLNGSQLAWASVLCALDPVAITGRDEQRLRLDLVERAVADGPAWCRKHAALTQIRCGRVKEGLAVLQGIAAEEDSGEIPELLAPYLALAYLANGDSNAAAKAWQTAEATDLEAIDTLSIQIELEVLLQELRTKQHAGKQVTEARLPSL